MKQYELMKEFHCVFADLPEHGKSVDCGSFSCENAAQAIIELIDALSPKEKVILISHSYGGLTTKLILEKIPERIEKVVIGSTNIIRSVSYWLYTRKIGCFIFWLSNRKRFKREQFSWKLVCRTQKDSWKNFQLPYYRKIVDIPALLLCAKYDINDIKKSMLLWKNCFSYTKSVTVENSGHNYFGECSDEVNQIIYKFITTL